MSLVLHTFPYCHLSTHEVSNHYLEQSWGYGWDNTYIEFLSKGNKYTHEHGRVILFAFCTSPYCNLSTMKFQDNTLKDHEVITRTNFIKKNVVDGQ